MKKFICPFCGKVCFYPNERMFEVEYVEKCKKYEIAKIRAERLDEIRKAQKTPERYLVNFDDVYLYTLIAEDRKGKEIEKTFCSIIELLNYCKELEFPDGIVNMIALALERKNDFIGGCWDYPKIKIIQKRIAEME